MMGSLVALPLLDGFSRVRVLGLELLIPCGLPGNHVLQEHFIAECHLCHAQRFPVTAVASPGLLCGRGPGW